MMPCLFPYDALSFSGIGYGVLQRVVSCDVRQELGSTGVYELEMEILTDDPLFNYIKVGNIIVSKPNLTDRNQAFVIEEITKPINNLVSVYATHIAQHLAKLITIAPVNATDLGDAISKILANSLETNPFSLTTNRSVATAYATDTPRSFRSVLGGEEGSLLDIYGGEYIWNNLNIELVNRRGRDNGVQVVYGQNMTGFEMKEEFNFEKSITGILPYWYSEDEGLVQGSIQYSDYVNYYKFKKTIVKDYTDDFEDKPLAAVLNSKAAADVKELGFPTTNIKVAMNQFDEKIQGDVMIMQLGDQVKVINPNYLVNMTSRIVALDFNVLSEQYNEIEIGQLEPSINEVIKQI